MAEATILIVAKSIISKLDNDDLSSLFPSVPDDTTLHDLQIIKELLIAIIGVLQDADPKEYTRTDVKISLRLARSVVYEIDDLLVEASFLLFSDISDFRIKLDNLWKDLQNLRIKQSRKTAACVNLLSSREIIGREGDKMTVINRILAAGDVRDLTVVVVIGMSGIGKTALAKLVFRDLAMDCFDAKVWVSAKPYISIERILQDVIQAATGEISSTTCRNELESKIQSVFKNQRFLLVIDDVDMESSPFWMELKSIVDVGKTGSVILITSKDEEVASIVQCVEIYYHYIGGISDSACWSIIKGLAFSEGEEERYPKLCETGKSIARKCGGVPFVAVCLGRLLQGERDEEEWLYIDKMDVASLQKSNGIPLLKLACDKLPSYLKPCFAFLALNQGDIDCTHQVFFWNGLGLLQVGDEKDDIESCGQTCLMELLSRSIIHDPVWTFDRKIISCKIHDVLKKLGMEVLGEDLAVVSCNNLTVSVLSRHIIWGYEKPNALFDKEFPEELLKAKKARTFRFGYPMDRISQPFLEGIISNMPYLHILDLGYSHFEVLPSSVGELKHLRVLNISFNPIIKSLPHTISKLSKLQAFFLQGCEQLEEIPSNIQNLINLKCFTVTTSQKSLLGMEFNHLPALQELQFLSCKRLVSLWECGDAGRLISLQRLRFHNCPQLGFLPNSMSLLFALKELVIADCQMLDLDEGKGLNALKCLESLEISGVPLLTYLPQGIQSAAKSLHYFSLRDCIGLVELPNWLQSFTYIRSFVIYNCPKLSTLPDGIFFITSLEKLEIRGCPLLSGWCVTIEGFSLIEHIPRIEIDGRRITREMKKQELSSSEDDETSNTAQISEISYLPGREEMKLHFHLFPSDYEFERETLVLLWIAAGYFRAGFMEESARRYFDGFVKEGYIILSGIDKFSGTSKYIINVDKAVNVANDGLYTLLRDENMEGEITKYQHISVVSNYINQKTFETLKKFNELRTVMFIHNYGPALNQVPSDIFLALPCMETLDLSGSHITELPGSIGNVTQLRYLDLSFTLIDRLPETIGRLVELQTLKLNGCDKLYNLPKGLKKLIRLRHLYFDVLGQLSFMPRGIGALTELRTLSAFIVDAEKGCNLSELRNMNNLSGYCCISGLENASDGDASESVLLHKRHLTHIQLRWDGYGAINDGIAFSPVSYLEPHSCLEKLEVVCYPNSRLPGWIFDEKFESLTSITFRKCENNSLGIYIGKLPNLKYLDIIQMNKVHIIDHFNHSDLGYVIFPKLEKLTINGMFSLAKWTVASDRSFPLLSKFSIKNCPNIPELNFLADLGSLEYLEISHCKALESLCDRRLLSKKLKTLVIDGCPLLKKKFSVNAEDWHKIKHVPEIWFDLVDMHSPEEDSHHSDSEEIDEDNDEDEDELEHKEDERQLKVVVKVLTVADEKTKKAMEAKQKQLMGGSNFTKEAHLLFSTSNQLVSPFKDARTIKDITGELSRVARNHSQFGSIVSSSSLNQTRTLTNVSVSYMSTDMVIGRDGDRDKMVSSLLDSSAAAGVLPVASFVGIGGVGKTTLAQYVYNDERIKRYFDLQFWVSATQDFNVKDVLRQMVTCATDDEKALDCGIDQLQRRLFQASTGKRFLLVLDDVWDDDSLRAKWLELRTLLRLGAEGSQVLLTTRSITAATIFGTQDPLMVTDLGNYDSWLLFRHVATTKWHELGVEAIAKEIANMCPKVPLVIRAIGSLLAGKHTVQEWQAFRNAQLANFASYGSDVIGTLKLSYDQLDTRLKLCVLYCSLFPKGFRFKKTSLVRLWIAMGYVQGEYTDQNPEEVGEGYVLSLLRRGFFYCNNMDGYKCPDIFRMHNLMHDLVLSIGGSKYKMADSYTNGFDERVRHVSYHLKEDSSWKVSSSLFKIKQLESFLLPLPSENMFPDSKPVRLFPLNDISIFRMESLRVLRMHGLGINKLPSSLGKLIRLRYLDFSFNYICELPDSITQLVNLYLLDLSNCGNLEKLPEDVSKLVALKHLNLYGCDKLSYMPKGLQRLTGLETLNSFIVGKPSNSLTLYGTKAKLAGDLADLGDIDNLKGELKIVLVDRSKDIVSEAKAANLDRKGIKKFTMEFRESRLEDEMVLENLKPSNSLNILCIEKYGGRRLPSWMREGIHLCVPNLVEIYMHNCKACINMCYFGRLPNLKYLKLETLDKVEYIENGDSNKSDMVVLADECSSAPLFPSLTQLILEDIPELKGWWSMTESAQDQNQNQILKLMPAFPRLHTLYLDMELVISLAQVFLQGISSLHTLNVIGKTTDEAEQRCGLSNVPPKQRQRVDFLNSYLPMLRQLYFRQNEIERLPEEFRGMSSLTSLTISECEALEAVPKWIDTLTSLEIITIEDCPRLKSLPHEMSNLSNLNDLILSNCSRELAERCQAPSGEDWPKIRHIPNIYILPA